MVRNFMSKKVVPAKVFDESDVLKTMVRELEPQEFEWMYKLMDEALEKSVTILRPMEILEWAGYGLFIGDADLIKRKDCDRFQQLLLKVWNDEFEPGAIKLRNMAGGTLYMWRISLRPEMWESYDNENRGGRVDIVTGKVYTVYKYFIAK
jgi:hypothetical protein